MGTLIRLALDFLEILFISVAVFILVYFFVGQPLEITGTSMVPTFQDKEQIIAEKVSVKYKPLYRGEVVIFKEPQSGRLLIKRVIGLPQDNIFLAEGEIYVNGQKLDEPYVNKKHATFGGEAIQENQEYSVPVDSYVVLGDNRENSSDSRVFGAIPTEDIVGRGVLVYFPIKNVRLVDNKIFEENKILSDTTNTMQKTVPSFSL